MRRRGGVALLAALWLVVAIATVALQFSIEAHERRTLGILASERGIQRGLAAGALSLLQARLEHVIRVAPQSTNPNVARLRVSDPWADVDSLYSGRVLVDSTEVEVRARDLGEQLNVNLLGETELQTFFSFLLRDYATATHLAQTIMDWRDADSIPRPNGAERDAYMKAGLLALPANAPFRDLEDLRDVMGMTEEIYNKARPYLTTRGTGAINVNSAPVPVLRAIPGMTDATINQIVQRRSQGRRISSIADIFPPARGGRRGAGQSPGGAIGNAIAGRIIFAANQVELTITARTGPQSSPTRLVAIVQRVGSATGPDASVRIPFREW